MTAFTERRHAHRPITKDIVVFYHGNCSDGFGGAWAAWKVLGDRAEYIAVEDHNVPPPGLKDKEIYMIDFTYNEPALSQMIADNKRVTAIDHHESVEKETRSTKDYLYASDHSGSVLAWQYFHPAEPIPEMLLAVEDFDLWRFVRPDTHELFAYLDLFDFAFTKWDELALEFADPAKREHILTTGTLLLAYEDKLADRIIANAAQLVEFEGYHVYAVNSGVFRSQIAGRLYVQRPPFGLVWRVERDLVLVSIRSNGKVDVAALAQKYGGGGHPGSAGFVVPSLAQLPWHPITAES